MDVRIYKHSRITNGGVWLNGVRCFEPVALPSDGNAPAFLTEIYYRMNLEYRKFFKMDTLSKLGFLASELLLEGADRNEPKEDMGIVLFNRSASLDTDAMYQKTIQRAEDYYPSPAVFVHTLPNIVTGEVAIRHQIHGETAFYVFRRFAPPIMAQIIHTTMLSAGLRYALAGWIEVCQGHADALMMLCKAGNPEEEEETRPLLTPENIEEIKQLSNPIK
jgi:hypothetical protein